MTPAARREAVAHLEQAYEMSERRACSRDRRGPIVGALSVSGDRTTPSCASALRELAAERRRFGYRRLHVLLRREGMVVNRKRTQRLYREEGLTVRRATRPQARHRNAGAAADRGRGRTRAGRSTSCTTSSLTAAASAS